MKIDIHSDSLRKKILIYFIVFIFALLLFLWIAQSVFLESYYQHSMKKKCANGLRDIESVFLREDVDYQEFYNVIGTVASENDLLVFIESIDGRFSISSAENSKPGVLIPKGMNVFVDAKRMLTSSFGNEISYTFKDSNGDILVCAKLVNNDAIGSVYMYVAAFLSPLGPAVEIIRSEFFIVAIVALCLGMLVSFIISKSLSKPISKMNHEAKKFADGNFDVRFEGGNIKEINELANTLNDAAIKIKASDKLQKDLLANVSHDIRTPLTMIKSYAEMIRDISGGNKKKREEHIGVIIEETDRLSNLVNDILFLSKVQSGADVFTKKKFDIQKAAYDIFLTYQVEENNGFSFSFEPIEGSVYVLGDEGKIKQVISNYISNAIKYSDKVKDIKIKFEKNNDNIRLSVIDKGVGISKSEIKMIWNRYQRSSERTVRNKDGHGLGLSICSEILKGHNAEYGVESRKGKGSSFWFEMKIAK